MRFKRIIALIISVMLIISMTACDFGTGKGSVYWLNFKPELDATLRSLADKYKEEKGVPVKIETPASGEYLQSLREQMKSEDPPSLFVINNQDAADEWKEAALDLSGTGIQDELNTSSYNFKTEENKLVAIPYCLECFGIAVNPDLLARMGFKVDDIKNFDSLKKVVETIHQNASWLGFDAFCSPDLDSGSSWRLTGHLANLEYYYEEQDSGSWKESPASITGAYLPNYKNLYDLCINNAVSAPETLAEGGHNPTEEFTSGKAAFFLTGSWDYATLSEKIPNVTMIPYYCGVKGEEKAGLNSGSENFWAVNAAVSEADQKATLDFMKWLVTDETASKAMVDQIGNMPYKNAAKSENGFLAKQNEYISNGNYRMDWLMLHQPNPATYRSELVTALSAYNADRTDANWDKVKEAFVGNWAKLYAEANNKVTIPTEGKMK
ncbi:ABC transporter substrate-binding protein [Ruminococcus sp.]|uniref:ABC transporter substrate-binding protein n=1 Tax=Ruminococcus sp. TaxID=41978 RepID=UPI002E80598F|nr:ABC transporter substrate-binding protein [Ruminococcus sp.]MEE3492586.1 ABC transporter substrate-binding protein [Ruminococcus sp.]